MLVSTPTHFSSRIWDVYIHTYTHVFVCVCTSSQSLLLPNNGGVPLSGEDSFVIPKRKHDFLRTCGAFLIYICRQSLINIVLHINESHTQIVNARMEKFEGYIHL
jgi:hypothetical protein